MIINGVIIETEEDLQIAVKYLDPASKKALTNIFRGTIPPTPIEQVKVIIDNAIDFGNILIRDFAAENVLMGITQDGMTGTVRKHLMGVVNCLNTGSLYDALKEVKAIPAEAKDPKYITNERLTTFCNKIEDYLRIPRTIIK